MAAFSGGGDPQSGRELLTGESVGHTSQLFDEILLEPTKQAIEDNIPQSYTLAPSPGFCLKTTSDKEEKIFVNVCTSELVLKPKDVTEKQLQEVIESNDPTKFRVPMSIGEPHKERDKSGKDCIAYDLVVHPDFFEKINASRYFMEFFLMLMFDGLESKYKMLLSREYVILKNRTSIGTLKTQMIRSTSTPVIMEMDKDAYAKEKDNIQAIQEMTSHNASADLVEVSTRTLDVSETTRAKKKIPLVPNHAFIYSPDKDDPEYLVTEVQLPGTETTSDATLDIGEDCLVLRSVKNNYVLDVILPVDVLVDETGAQFNRTTHVLTITMKVNKER